jgi:hypothetical protein
MDGGHIGGYRSATDHEKGSQQYSRKSLELRRVAFDVHTARILPAPAPHAKAPVGSKEVYTLRGSRTFPWCEPSTAAT